MTSLRVKALIFVDRVSIVGSRTANVNIEVAVSNADQNVMVLATILPS